MQGRAGYLLVAFSTVSGERQQVNHGDPWERR